MGCGGSKSTTEAAGAPSPVAAPHVDQAALAAAMKLHEGKDEERQQQSAAKKAEDAEKAARAAESEAIANQFRGALADKKLSESRAASQTLLDENEKSVVNSFMGSGAKLKFRKAMAEGNISDASDAAVRMIQAAFRMHIARKKINLCRLEAKALLREGMARKLQTAYRCRLARKKAQEMREKKKNIIGLESERRALQQSRSANLDEIKVALPTPSLMKGFINKTGQNFSTVKLRYFVLEYIQGDSKLTYYVKQLAKAPWGEDEKGFIFLKGAMLVDKPGTKYMISDRNGRDLELNFQSTSDKVVWKKAFEEHVQYLTSVKR